MEHIAIDLGGKKSRICVRDSKGTILEERNYSTERLSQYLENRPVSQVVLETCSEAFAIADQAKQLGHEVKVVPATTVKALGVAAAGSRRTKRMRECSARSRVESTYRRFTSPRHERATGKPCARRETVWWHLEPNSSITSEAG